MIRDFLSGINFLLRGFNLIIRPDLRRFVVIPLIINTLVFMAAILLGIHQFNNLLDWLLPEKNSWWFEFARIAMWVFFTAGLLFVVFFTFTLAANLLGAPFNGLLSEKIETHLSGEMRQESGGLRDIIPGILPSLLNEFRKLMYFLILGVTVFVLSLIPVVNAIAPFLWAVFASWVLALEYIAYPMENHKIHFSQARAELKKKRIISLGFGTAVMFTTIIPLINLLVMPAAVAGATAMWVERLNRGRINSG